MKEIGLVLKKLSLENIEQSIEDSISKGTCQIGPRILFHKLKSTVVDPDPYPDPAGPVII
jgi:hypothetical protein